MAARLTIKARLFAVQRELAGTREVRLELSDGATVEDAWGDLVRRFPVLAPGRPFVRFARNGEYTDPGATLGDGDELAVIPPVSGGAAVPRYRRLEITADPIDDGLLATLREEVGHPAVGGIVSFLGVTRATPGTPAPGEEAEAARHAGEQVLGLEYEAFEALALRVLGEIADEIERLHDVPRLAVVHRTGAVPVGEASVAIVAAATHRDAAFAAARYAIDELKARAPIWKAERFADGSVWIGQPARLGADNADARVVGGGERP